MSLSLHLRRTTALFGGVLSAAVMAAPALAQTAPAATQPAAEVEEVVVTGTRLRLPDYSSTNPVVSVTAETIESAGVTNITDFLTDLPALISSTTLNDNSNAGDRARVGLNQLNLRNLGVDRTLTLVNGRRHVAGSAGDSAVDVNSIPVGLIERIETLTGGASAVYGADGVAGVVNFILKDDFEGREVRTQYNWTAEGGGENLMVQGLWGDNFHDGRGNITLGAEYNKAYRLAREDRDFASLDGLESIIVNQSYTGAPGQYQRSFARNARYIDTSPGGSVQTDLDFGDSFYGNDFNGDGTPWHDGDYGGGFVMVGGDGSQLAAFQTDIIPGVERAALNLTYRYDLTPNHRFFAEAKAMRTQSTFESQASFDYGLFVPMDNPYMPASIRADASGPDGLGGAIGGVLIARDNFDLGFVARDVQRDTYRVVFGLQGNLLDDVAYEMSVNYGKVLEDNLETNNRISERWFAAIDAVRDPATGQIVCRSNLDPSAIPLGDFFSPFDASTWGTTFTPGANSGCVPLNIFGDGVMTEEARDWVMGEARSSSSIDQLVFNAFLSGDSQRLFTLPAGAVSWVLGVEYRRETAEFKPSEEERLGAQTGYDVTWLGAAEPLNGAFDTSEVFAEVSVPLLRDLPFAKDLTLDAAYRYSDYSTVGQTEAWKLGLRWQVNDSLAFRATDAQAVRAPNIGELFTAQNQTFALLADPCDNDNFNAGDNPAVREANCRALLGYGPSTPYTFNDTTSSSVEGRVGGNPDLGPEDAQTFTAGVVFTPSFLRGLSVSLDWYDIELSNAIQLFSAQTIVNKCYDLPQPNQFCGLLTRDATTSFIDSFQQFSVNVASYTTQGWDLNLRYDLDPANFGIDRDIGRFTFSLIASKLEDLTFTEDPSDPLSIDDDLGTRFAPEYQATLDLTWRWRDLTVNYGYNWFDETIRFEGRPDDFIEPEYMNWSARSVQDIQVKWTIDDRIDVFGGINNITDQRNDRSFDRIAYPVNALGKTFYLGLNVTL